MAEIILGQQLKRTKVVEKSLTPSWNETFRFNLRDENNPTTPLGILAVVLYDNDRGMLYGNTKKYLGSVDLPINALLINGSGESWCVPWLTLV
jgi:hypothetical protein